MRVVRMGLNRFLCSAGFVGAAGAFDADLCDWVCEYPTGARGPAA